MRNEQLLRDCQEKRRTTWLFPEGGCPWFQPSLSGISRREQPQEKKSLCGEDVNMSVLLKTDRNKLNGQKTYLTTYLLTYLTCPPDPGESANSTIDDGNSARRTSNGNRVLEVFFVFVGLVLVLVSFSFCFGLVWFSFWFLVFDRHTHSFTHTRVTHLWD